MNRPPFRTAPLWAAASGALVLTVAGACSDTVAPEKDLHALAGPSLSVVAASPALETFFGPERFTRGRGAPETFTRQIPTTGFEAPFMLHVRSGDPNGANRVSSASVSLDGTTLLAPSVFNQQQGEWALPVALGSTAEFSVSLASAPGSHLEIWVEGKRSGTLFCPDGRAGAIADLREAIAATPAGGTVLVCSGTHSVSNVSISKPLTLEGVGPTKPILDAGGVSFSLAILGAVGGPVRIHGLRFKNGKWGEVMVEGPTDSVVIEDSEFYPGTQSPGSPWGVYSGVRIRQATSVLIQDNTFNGGDIGGTAASGSDNTISSVASVLYVYKATSVTLRRNDFTGYAKAIQYINTPGTVSLTCNWWGSADGPRTPPGNVGAGTYAPWATQPIAGTTVSCDPTAPVTAMRVCSTATEGGPMTAATFSQAYDFVPAGGTISFCAGTHAVSNASIAKPLTVTSESGAMATLDGGAASMVFFVSNSDAAGAVNITRLRFTGGTSSNVAIGSNAGTVNVSANEFKPPRTGLDCNDFSTLNIENNRFVGGNVGVNIDSRSGTPALRGNTFENQNDASIGLHGSLPSPILVERNTFRGCGPSWCLFTELAVTAVANTVEIDIGRPTHSPFVISNSHGGTSVVTDNVIIGLRVGGTDRTSQSSYPIRSYAVHVVGAGRVERNRITNAYTGIGATPASLTGSDNVIEHTYAPFGGGGDPSTSTITATRNDLSDYIVTLNGLGVFSAVSLKCNYWGSASGPTGITGDPAWYEPFSAQPIASKPAVICP